MRRFFISVRVARIVSVLTSGTGPRESSPIGFSRRPLVQFIKQRDCPPQMGDRGPTASDHAPFGRRQPDMAEVGVGASRRRIYLGHAPHSGHIPYLRQANSEAAPSTGGNDARPMTNTVPRADGRLNSSAHRQT